MPAQAYFPGLSAGGCEDLEDVLLGVYAGLEEYEPVGFYSDWTQSQIALVKRMGFSLRYSFGGAGASFEAMVYFFVLSLFLLRITTQ